MQPEHINDFNQCLAQSHAAEELPIWEEVYRQAFPAFNGMVSYRQDGFWQREGIDRGVILDTTKQIFIDEKIRGRNKRTGKVYNDIALEYLSNDRARTKGWVCKPLRADYIAYLIAPLGVCYLLPVIQLQNAWAKHKEQWKLAYQIIEAPNPGYKTVSCCVPANDVFKAMGQELRVNFEPFEVAA